jgi:hypothetical protein
MQVHVVQLCTELFETKQNIIDDTVDRVTGHKSYFQQYFSNTIAISFITKKKPSHIKLNQVHLTIG